MDSKNLTEDLAALLKSAVAETGVDLGESAESIAAYASTRAEHLATLVGKAGFQEALIAERDSVALRAGIAVSRMANAGESRLLGILQGALAIAARLLMPVRP